MRRICPLLALLLVLSCSRRPAEESGTSRQTDAGVVRPQMLVIAVGEEPDQLVPPFARSLSSAAIWPWILPSLVRVEGDSLQRGQIVGDVATSWQFEDGGRAVRFFLGTSRLWEDTTAVGPPDVVESYRLYRDPATGGDWAHRLAEIVSVEASAASPGAVLFRFRRPLARQQALRLASLPVISAEQWTRSRDRRPLLGGPGRLVNAAGPFRVEEWKAGQFMRLARHPFPPEGRVPRADRILLRFVPSGRSRALQLEQGVVDLALDLPVEEADRLREGTDHVRLARAGPAGIEALAWNLDHPLWSRWDLRHAVLTHLDLLRLRGAATAMEAVTSNQVCTGFLETAADSGRTAEAADSASAFGAWGSPSLELLYDAADARRERVAVDIALQLDRFGLPCHLLPRAADDCTARIAERRFAAALVGWTLPALVDLGEIYGTGGMENVAGLSDAGVDSLIAWARSAAADTVADAWNQVEARARVRLPYIFIDARARIDGLGPGLSGYQPDPWEAYGDLLSVEWIGSTRRSPRSRGRERVGLNRSDPVRIDR